MASQGRRFLSIDRLGVPAYELVVNIVGPDGRLALVISNRERTPRGDSVRKGAFARAVGRTRGIRRADFLSTHRLFLGSDDRTAAVRLRDTRGRVRVRLFVDTSDVARLEFLDAEGKVVHAIPDRAQP